MKNKQLTLLQKSELTHFVDIDEVKNQLFF